MLGKIILATILVIIAFVIYKLVHACKTGDAGGSLLGRIAMFPCKLLFGS